MNDILRKLIVLLLVFVLGLSPCMAASDKVIADVSSGFGLTQGTPPVIQLKAIRKTIIDDKIIIPQRSVVTLEVLQAQKERRWHKSGCIVCKLKNYEDELTKEIIDLSDKDIYFVVRKYEPLDKKGASITATEIVLTQAASLFAPGVDILYFFTKGAIQRHKNPNWFKAGVYNAYDNSVCWFWLKGKPIDLKKNEQVYVKNVNEPRAEELKGQIDRRQEKQKFRDDKNQASIDYIEHKKDLKNKYKEQKAQLKQSADDENIEDEKAAKNEIKEKKQQLKNDYKTQRQQLKQQKKYRYTQLKQRHNEYKQHSKENKQRLKAKKKQWEQARKDKQKKQSEQQEEKAKI